MSTIRKAARADLDAVCRIYDQIHTAEERGEAAIGWQRGVYPERETAEAALTRGDLFVQEQNGEIVGTAILNQTQVDSYAGANWRYDAPDSEVMVLHTLVIDPEAKSRGLGREFAAFYEGYALAHGCRYLRIDTNARNARAPAASIKSSATPRSASCRARLTVSPVCSSCCLKSGCRRCDKSRRTKRRACARACRPCPSTTTACP